MKWFQLFGSRGLEGQTSRKSFYILETTGSDQKHSAKRVDSLKNVFQYFTLFWTEIVKITSSAVTCLQKSLHIDKNWLKFASQSQSIIYKFCNINSLPQWCVMHLFPLLGHAMCPSHLPCMFTLSESLLCPPKWASIDYQHCYSQAE